MKNPVVLAALFMSGFALILAGAAMMFIYTATVEEVKGVKDQLQYMDNLIDETKQRLSQKPDSRKLKIELEKQHMERVLIPQPWLLEMEMAENGPVSFLFNVLGSAEARKEKLRGLVLERAAKTDLTGCPQEFQRLFRIYASPTGYGSESLQNLRDFAEKHTGSDDFGSPDAAQTEQSE